MLHTKFLIFGPSGSKEKDFFKYVSMYFYGSNPGNHMAGPFSVTVTFI